MWTKYLDLVHRKTINTINSETETSASVFEFITILESIKYLKFLHLHFKTPLIDVTKKLELIGVSQEVLEELDSYRHIRNEACHNLKGLRIRLADQDFFEEHVPLVYNLVGLIVKEVTSKKVDFLKVEEMYEKYLYQTYSPKYVNKVKVKNKNLLKNNLMDSKQISESNVFGSKNK